MPGIIIVAGVTLALLSMATIVMAPVAIYKAIKVLNQILREEDL